MGAGEKSEWGDFRYGGHFVRHGFLPSLVLLSFISRGGFWVLDVQQMQAKRSGDSLSVHDYRNVYVLFLGIYLLIIQFVFHLQYLATSM